MKRILCAVLAVVLIASLVGCGRGRREPIQLTLSTEDSAAILAAAGITLPDASEAAGAGTEVKWFGWSDPFQNYSEDEIINTGFYTFTEKYGNTIKVVETTYEQHNDDLAQLVLSDEAPDLMPGGSNSTAIFPMNATKQMIQPCDPWIDFDNPLWAPMKDLADLFAIGDKHYQICITTKPANVVVYNKRVVDSWGFEDPAELYYNDEWTWDKFSDMCMEFSNVDEDRFALDGYAYVSMFMESTGEQVLMHDTVNGYWSNIDSPKIERAMQYLYELKKNDCTYRGKDGSRWALRDNGTFGAGLKDGLCLFYVIGESFFTNTVEMISSVWGDIEAGEVMFAPLPRDPEGDGVYYCQSSFDDVKGAMGIVNNAKNPEGAALLAACIRFKVIDPVVIKIDERQLRDTYKWNDDMIDMSRVCQEIADANFVVDPTGNLPDNLQNAIRNMMGDGIIRTANDTSWAQLKENNSETIDYFIDELNAELDELANS